VALRFQISRKLVAAEPCELWNAFLEFLCREPEPGITQWEYVARLAFLYDGEVQNGGHLQYFVNGSAELAHETIAALQAPGARRQTEILTTALSRYESKERETIQTITAYSAEAGRGEYADLDTAYYACKPDTCGHLEQFLNVHLDDFVEWVD
jgi:hypothetical protein